MGPMVILAGGLLLMGTELADARRNRKEKRSQSAARTEKGSNRHAQARRRVFLSTAFAAGLPLVLIALILVGIYAPWQYGPAIGVPFLFSSLYSFLSFLMPISLLFVIVSIHLYAPPTKRGWTRIGVVLAALYAISSSFYSLFGLSLSFYRSVTDAFPFLARSGLVTTINFAIMSIAGLCILPVLGSTRLERVIRWSLAIMPLAALAAVLGLLLSTSRILTVPMVISLAGSIIVLPFIMLLLATVFRRSEIRDAPLSNSQD